MALLCALPAAAEPERVWLELRRPAEGFVQRTPLPLLELRGMAGAGASLYHDLVIAIDLSVSTRLPSGVDVDGDGLVGKSDAEVREDNWGSAAPEMLCDDPGDTIAAAEIAATRRLLEIVDPEITRVALVAFGDQGHLEAPLGSSRAELGATLARLSARAGWYGGTHYGDALRTARDELVSAPRHGRERRRTVLFLSDGFPSMPIPPPGRPREEALAAAREVAQATARLDVFALGPEARKGEDVLLEMAAISAGALTLLERPGDVLFHLPAVELSDIVDLRLENVTAAKPGRAVRLFPDGSFDGFVPLERGANRLRVTAISAKGGRATLERSVLYDPDSARDGDLALEVERLRQLVRDRTIEVELAAEMKRKARAARERSLEIAPERRPQPPAQPQN
jgi:hypothetical protein